MKVNLILFSLFLLVSIMACNVFAFSISGGVSERSYKETEKTSAMTTTHSTNCLLYTSPSPRDCS